MSMLFVYWPALFAVGIALMVAFLDPWPPTFDKRGRPVAFDVAKAGEEMWPPMWPPTFDTSGAQASRFLINPFFLATFLPVLVGCVYFRCGKSSPYKSNSSAQVAPLSPSLRIGGSTSSIVEEHAAAVWWLTNLFWFHIGCDILSGYFQVMPVMSDLYRRSNPAHMEERWHPRRGHLDAVYFLEILVEVPLAIWVLYLYLTRNPARQRVETFALAVQLAGAVAYYAPGIIRGEPAACWMTYLDRACGAIWVIYPLLRLRGGVSKVRLEAAAARERQTEFQRSPGSPTGGRGRGRRS